jgi:hypothetical protein
MTSLGKVLLLKRPLELGFSNTATLTDFIYFTITLYKAPTAFSSLYAPFHDCHQTKPPN